MSKQERVQINQNPEDNPKMKEIFDILLLAGYFRIRIPSINTFDKILGGLVWCITCSNFEIDISYNEDMNIGQKIKIAEKICQALKKMACPIDIQPFQISGLDSDKIYPIIQWLIKFVYETRETRQDFNKTISNFVGRRVYTSFQENDQKEKQIIEQTTKQFMHTLDKRQTTNTKKSKLNMKDPLRIYSTLIEFGDVTAYKTYNKLAALLSGKLNLEEQKAKQKQKAEQIQQAGKSGSKQQNSQQQQPQAQLLLQQQQQKDQKGGRGKEQQLDVQALLFHATSSLEKAALLDNSTLANISQKAQQTQVTNQFDDTKKDEKIIEQIQIEKEDLRLDDEEKDTFRKLERKQSKLGDNIQKLVLENQEKISESLKENQEKNDDLLDFANVLKNEKDFHQTQVEAIQKKLILFEKKIEELSEELQGVKENADTLESQYIQHQTLNKELEDTYKKIDSKIEAIQKKSGASTGANAVDEAQQQVERKQELEAYKQELKKSIKTQIVELEKEKDKAEKEINKIDEPLSQIMLDETAQKKEKYDKKFGELAKLNQYIAVIQRKIENVPSATEIGQYHQRFVELFEAINTESEKHKDYYNQINNAQDLKSLLIEYVDLMRTFKENYQTNLKSKKGKEDMLKDLNEAYKGLLTNQNKTADLIKKVKLQKDQSVEAYNQLLHLEREYFKLIKSLKMEYDKNEYYMNLAEQKLQQMQSQQQQGQYQQQQYYSQDQTSYYQQQSEQQMYQSQMQQQQYNQQNYNQQQQQSQYQYQQSYVQQQSQANYQQQMQYN